MRTLSPSKSIVYLPWMLSAFSISFASTDFPAPESPVNHKVAGFCPIFAARVLRVMSSFCHVRLSALRRECSMTPHAEVMFVMRSVNMKQPSPLCPANVSYTASSAMAMSQTAISFLYSCAAARCSPEWMSTLYLTAITVAGSIFVPILIRKFFPWTSSISSIQRIDAVNILLTFSWVPLTRTHPRDTSTSRFSCIVSGCPFPASSTLRSARKIDCTHAFSPLGSTMTSSPAEMLPDNACP